MIKTFLRIAAIVGCFCLVSGFRLSGASHSNDSTHVITQEPHHIALLLPLSAEKYADAAETIRNGFFASYYQSILPGMPKPVIRVYDTAKDHDVQKIYALAVQEGADFVVGPLTKEEVIKISQLHSHAVTVPILALNAPPQAKRHPKLIQFALLPETETEHIVQKAWADGHRRVAMVVSHSAWGDRIAEAFSTEWQARGGQITQIEKMAPNSDHSAGIRRLLGIAADHDLKETPPEFQFDWIFLATDPAQARQIKPLLNFYYAHKIPVYATSSVYSGMADPLLDNDLNGIILCDIPWLVTPSDHFTKPHHINDYRLFAMGMDAYQLTQQLNDLQLGKIYAGLTGQLSLSQHTIQRRLSFAKIRQGVLQPL